MPRNGSGTYTRSNGVNTGASLWQADRDAGTKITAPLHDTHDEDIADALTASLAKDGQTAPTANLPMAGFNHTGVGDATARDEYATLGQVQDSGGVYIADTGIADVYAIAPVPGVGALAAGQLHRVLIGTLNTGASTLNVNGLGAKNIVWPDGSALVAGDLPANANVEVIYNGTVYHLLTVANQPGTAAYVDTGAAAGEVGLNDQAFADIASATTTDIGAEASLNVRITGTTTITGLGTVASGIRRKVRFAAALTLTHNGTSLILPGSANITTAANDTAEFHSLGSGNWLCHSYKKADGTPTIDGSGMVPLATYSLSSDATLDITSVLTATYKTFLIVMNNLIPATDDVQLRLRTSTDNSTFDSGASDYSYAAQGRLQDNAALTQSGVSSLIALGPAAGGGGGVGNGSSEGVSGTIRISDPLNAATETKLRYEIEFVNAAATSQIASMQGAARRATAADVDAVQLFFSSGNIASGEVRVYGFKEP
jgi:hypothetical protein